MQMLIKKFILPPWNSNTYLITGFMRNAAWLIDAGEINSILDYLPDGVLIKGVFITHSHFDHIIGLNILKERFPDCRIFVSNHGKEGLLSEKINLSFYHEDPFIFKYNSIEILKEHDSVLLDHGINIEVIETPGHNQGCLTYKLKDFLFTGDSFIPGHDVVTKLKWGDKEANVVSLQKIRNQINQDTNICPGHGDICKAIDLPKLPVY